VSPPERSIADLVAEATARAVLYTAVDPDVQPQTPAHLAQERIARSGMTTSSFECALAIIEHLSEAFEQEDPERAVTDLGKVCVLAAWLAAAHDLAIAPILALARALTRHPDARTQHAAGRLAKAVSGAPRPAALVDALALCIARGILDCEILYDLEIDIAGVYQTVAGEMLAARVSTW